MISDSAFHPRNASPFHRFKLQLATADFARFLPFAALEKALAVVP
jgi:hypothetical protein